MAEENPKTDEQRRVEAAVADATAARPSTAAPQPVVVEGRPLTPPARKDETKPYVLKEGMEHWHQGELKVAGDTVELTEAHHKAFGDKFRAADAPPPAPPAAPEPTPKGTSGVAQDIGAKTPNPDAPEPVPTTPGLGAATTASGGATAAPVPPGPVAAGTKVTATPATVTPKK